MSTIEFTTLSFVSFLDYHVTENENRTNLTSTTLRYKVKLDFPKNVLSILKSNKLLFKRFGLSYKCNETNVDIIKIPTCIFNKYLKAVRSFSVNILTFHRNNYHNVVGADYNSCFILQKNLESEIKPIITKLITETIDTLKDTKSNTNQLPNIIKAIVSLEACRGLQFLLKSMIPFIYSYL